jgi:hypothetical protein
MKALYRNKSADLWYEELVENPSKIPFYFTYGGVVYELSALEIVDKRRKKQGDI